MSADLSADTAGTLSPTDLSLVPLLACLLTFPPAAYHMTVLDETVARGCEQLAQRRAGKCAQAMH